MIERGVSVGCDNVLGLYDGFTNGSPDATFSVWYGEKSKYFEPPKAMTKEDRRDFLDKFLDSLEKQKDCSLYYLKIHEKQPKGLIDKNTEYLVAMPFRAVDIPIEQKLAGNYQGVPVVYRPENNNTALEAKLDKLTDLVTAQQLQITALSELEDEPFDDRPKGLMGQLSGLLENEQVVTMIAGQIGQVLQKVIGSVMAPQQPQQHTTILNGMPEKETLNFDFPKSEEIDLQLLDETLSRLSRHFSLNTDLPKMADYLDKNPGKAKMLLSFLSD